MWQITIPHPSLPVAFRCREDATIAFIRTFNFTDIVEGNLSGVYSSFGEFDFKIGDEILQYGLQYSYKDLPELLQWFKEQNMIMQEF